MIFRLCTVQHTSVAHVHDPNEVGIKRMHRIKENRKVWIQEPVSVGNGVKVDEHYWAVLIVGDAVEGE